MNEKNQASVHDIAYLFWDEPLKKDITDDNVSKALSWLLDAINSGKLEAWHNAKKINEIQDFKASAENDDKIFVNFLALRVFLNESMDVTFKKNFNWEIFMESMKYPIDSLGNPKEDLTLFFKILPASIKNDLLKQGAALKKQKKLLSAEDFIRGLKFTFENNYEIKIQKSGKRAKTYTSDSLGFNSVETKEWKTLEILQTPPHIYQVGKAGKARTGIRKEYDKKKKLLDAINQKLIKFINDHLSPSIPIPKSYKLYELCPEYEKGTYKFKFQTGDNKDDKDIFESNCEKLSKEKLIENLLGRLKEYSKNPNANYLKKKIDTIKSVLINKYEMTENGIKDLMFPSTDKEEIEKEFSDVRYEKSSYEKPSFDK